ncbi:MAG TPA: beta-methylarginine biosynthesis bifunctional aminotransferase [Hyalangium sp.]|nr:beta-methylarginine biosynthesis bifunctional aminotransferase [Hyalangium sp.]
MNRVTLKDSPYTFLQQRLGYMERHPDRAWTSICENVPQWPAGRLPPLAVAEPRYVTEYAPASGYSELVEAIASREQRMYGFRPPQESVLVTNGALHALSLIFRAHYRPGAAVLCQAPVLGSITEILRHCGYRIIFFQVTRGRVDVERLRTECTEDVRLIYFNSPHNPSGEVCTRETVEQLVALAQERQAGLVADMIYDSYCFGEERPINPLMISQDWQRLYAVNSMSKNYGAPGLRIGWIVSDPRNIAPLGGALERETVAVSGISQVQARRMLEHGNEALLEAVRQGRQTISERLSSFITGVECEPPAGGVQYFLRLPVADVEAFGDYMLVEHGLVLVTTSNYDGLGGSFMRLPMGYPVATLQRAMELLSLGLSAARERM